MSQYVTTVGEELARGWESAGNHLWCNEGVGEWAWHEHW